MRTLNQDTREVVLRSLEHSADGSIRAYPNEFERAFDNFVTSCVTEWFGSYAKLRLVSKGCHSIVKEFMVLTNFEVETRSMRATIDSVRDTLELTQSNLYMARQHCTSSNRHVRMLQEANMWLRKENDVLCNQELELANYQYFLTQMRSENSGLRDEIRELRRGTSKDRTEIDRLRWLNEEREKELKTLRHDLCNTLDDREEARAYICRLTTHLENNASYSAKCLTKALNDGAKSETEKRLFQSKHDRMALALKKSEAEVADLREQLEKMKTAS